jgi:hypothetical protein
MRRLLTALTAVVTLGAFGQSIVLDHFRCVYRTAPRGIYF